MGNREVLRFVENQRKDEKKAKKKEKKRVYIEPNSLIGREIQYQTALLHEILDELREMKRDRTRRESPCPESYLPNAELSKTSFKP